MLSAQPEIPADLVPGGVSRGTQKDAVLMPQDPLKVVLEYHERTKHHFDRSARSLGYLDWATQPDPFRRFDGAPQVPLDEPPLLPQPTYDALFQPGSVAVQPVNRHTISRLFYHALALSAWKQAPARRGGRCGSIRPAARCIRPKAI